MIRLIKTTIILAAYMVCTSMAAQDVRTLKTRIADLLVQMPASDLDYRDMLAEETYNLGNRGREMICSMVVSPGTGDDTGARFAIESLSKYLTREKPSERTEKWEMECIGFATRGTDKDVQAFFIRQLQWVGGSATIAALAPLLPDEYFCNPVVSAMKYADPGKAGELLASRLSSLSGTPEIATVKALGELKVTSANGLLLEMLSGKNETDLQRNILRSLALIGSPDSYKFLLNAAKETGFAPEGTGATASLLEYARTLGDNGNEELSKKICLDLMKNCKDPSQTHFKSAALIIYADVAGIQDAMPVLIKAMKDPDKACRMSIIKYAMHNPGPVEPWVNLLESSKDTKVQAEIIYLLASKKEKSTLGTIHGFLDSPDNSVQSEALNALASIEGPDAVNPIITFMFEHSSEADLMAARSALLSTATAGKLIQHIDRISSAPDPVKIVLLEVFAEKGSPEFFQVLMDNTSNGNRDVSHAAFRGLKKVATSENLDVLLDLLDESQDLTATAEIQQAVVSAVNLSEDKGANTDLVLSSMKKAADEIAYIPVLSGIGGAEGLNSVKNIYDNSQGETRKLALEALVDWSDDTAIPVLFDICKESGSEYAFSGYVSQVNRSKHTPDQKLLLLRKIMPLASDTGQKTEIIEACSGIKTFLSFVFISGYLEDELLGQAAANAAIQVALPGPGKEDGLHGDIVRAALMKAKEIIAGPESPYVKIDVETYLKNMSGEQGFVPLFNGTDLSGWQGLVEDPIARAKMGEKELARKQAEADDLMHACWNAQNGILMFNGKGQNICTIKQYGDFEMIVDWRINKNGDSGIYLRGTPQVQIWDTSRVDVGAQVGSGGLYNNQKNPSKPLQVADNVIPDWNTFQITMIGEKVTVYLNGILVVDNVVMENYWDRSIPIFPEGPIELQAHGNDIAFRDVYVREIQGIELSPEEKEEGFVLLFNGKNLDGWIGNKTNHVVENGEIAIRPELGGHGNLYTEKEYANFNLRLEFKLTPGANNGLGIRTPPEGDAAYVGMEFQVLDNTAPVYANLEPYQYHGSVYGVIPAKRGFLKPVGEWNEQEVIVDGTKIKIILNGTVIVDGDIADSIVNGTLDGRDHPGLKRKTGHIGFLGHGSELWYRNIRIKELD